MSEDNDRWREARGRMAPSIDAVFFQDFGIGGGEKQRSVDWILDHIVRPEFDKALGVSTPDVWCVMRDDEDGSHSVAVAGLSFNDATSKVHELESQTRNQFFWVRRQ